MIKVASWVRLRGPVMQANGRLIFEDDLRSGGLLCLTTQWTSVCIELANSMVILDNLRKAACQEMSTLHAGYLPQCKLTLASSSGPPGFIMNFHCVWTVVGWLMCTKMGDYLYRGQYCQTVNRRLWWYWLQGQNIIMAKPSTFLESRFW